MHRDIQIQAAGDRPSKGRNGWFRPRRVYVRGAFINHVQFEIWSSNERGQPPIDVYLDPAAARELGQALIEAARETVKGA